MVNGFKLGEDKLDLASNKIAANTAVIDGTDSGGIGSHSISNGLISFDDINSALFTVTTDNIASAFAYLQANITGNQTVAFNSDGNTYVFQDGGANDTLVQLTGITANALVRLAWLMMQYGLYKSCLLHKIMPYLLNLLADFNNFGLIYNRTLPL